MESAIQFVVNIVVAIILPVLAGIIKLVLDTKKEIGQLEVKLVENYVPRTQLEKNFETIAEGLDKILTKLDTKVDKTFCERIHDNILSDRS